MSEPTGLSQLLSPDNIAGILAGTASSLVAALQAQVRGFGILVSNVAAALLTSAVIPVAQSRGYSYGDWLLFICVLTGIFSGTAFLLVAKVANRLLERSNEMTDKMINKFGKGEKP